MPVCLAISRHWRFTSLASALRQRPAQRRNQPATRSKAPSGARRDPAIGSAPSPTDAAEELWASPGFVDTPNRTKSAIGVSHGEEAAAASVLAGVQGGSDQGGAGEREECQHRGALARPDRDGAAALDGPGGGRCRAQRQRPA